MKSSISKRRAKKKFYRGDFESLRQHENVESAYQEIEGFGELEIICRYHITKDKKVEITPIGIVISNEPIVGKVKLKLTEIADAEGIAIEDIDGNGNYVKTLGIQMSVEVMEGLIHYENIHEQIMPKV